MMPYERTVFFAVATVALVEMALWMTACYGVR
jgi:hypothetical protein